MLKLDKLLYYWVPPFSWMGAIFYMSSQKSVAMSTNVVAEFVTFKTLHMIEYAFLFFLFYRAFLSIKKYGPKLAPFYAFSVVLFYSMTDELHQLYIPTRQGRVRDVLFDLAGMIVMYGIIKKVSLVKKLL